MAQQLQPRGQTGCRTYRQHHEMCRPAADYTVVSGRFLQCLLASGRCTNAIQCRARPETGQSISCTLWGIRYQLISFMIIMIQIAWNLGCRGEHGANSLLLRGLLCKRGPKPTRHSIF